MASATRIVIKAEDTGFWKAKQDEETAAKLLALYGTGAPESAIQAAFDANAGYQLKHTPARPHVVAELQADWAAHAPKYLGRGAYYSDFLRFFQDEVDRRGWQAVVAAFLCAPGDAASPARHMVQRLFSGLVHPMIQLGFGLEWEQPAIVAQGLAQAAVHRNTLGDFFDRVDEAVAAGRGGEQRGLSDICESLRAENSSLASAAEWRDGDQSLYAGVLGRGLDEAVALCAQPCFPAAARVRILEHKMRYDVLQYAARGAPRLSPAHVAAYLDTNSDLVPGQRAEDLLPRYHAVADDGHAVKAARALLLAQRVSRRWAGRPWVRLRDDADWRGAHCMLLRGVEGDEPLWVRGAGFDQAWEGVPLL
ncbi:Oxidoreductase AflY [Metarhizium anisopliae]